MMEVTLSHADHLTIPMDNIKTKATVFKQL